MLFIALLLAAERPIDVPMSEMLEQALVGQNHRVPEYAARMATICEMAIKSGNVRAYLAENFPEGVGSPSGMDGAATDCAIYGYGKSAR